MVARHFYFSCLECRRRAAKLVRRYTWKADGRQLILWLPVEMSGSRCRSWLQENVPDLDPTRPSERDRVQALIDQRLTRRRVLSLEQLHAAIRPRLRLALVISQNLHNLLYRYAQLKGCFDVPARAGRLQVRARRFKPPQISSIVLRGRIPLIHGFMPIAGTARPIRGPNHPLRPKVRLRRPFPGANGSFAGRVAALVARRGLLTSLVEVRRPEGSAYIGAEEQRPEHRHRHSP